MKENLLDWFVGHVLSAFEEAYRSEAWDGPVAMALLDWLAITMAGLSESRCDTVDKITPVVFDARLLPGGICVSKAILYGMASHCLELDDGYRAGGVHVGAPVISALVASDVNADWPTIRQAVLCGYEATGTIARLMQPGHKRRGFHATGTCGCIGGAVAVAIAAGQSVNEIKRTVSAAASMASGLLEMQEDGSQMKALTVGNAALNGIVAAAVGGGNLRFPADALGGPRGLFSCMDASGSAPTDAEGFCLANVYRKLYPSCRHGHSAIDAAFAIQKSRGFDPNDIKDIEIATYKDAILGHNLVDISTDSQAKMSTPYCVASVFVRGSFGLDSFDEAALRDPMVHGLMQKTHVVEAKELSELAPQKRGARVTVTLGDGTRLAKEILDPKGEPENPLSAEELVDKCAPLLMRSGLSDKATQKCIEKLLVSCQCSLQELRSYLTLEERNKR
ncbi:MmgE/PrpD family protein [Adlercreutzia sp. ZJ473]|uniref:MmgE/PrpD family protein n=1 Tax=Adlercreutzia sp. ZJ473 TaxID=2722822 RepID=UPI0015534805|nr:MmgE/PrpD family protein [Adlercreutzia sp. ZJ473]